MPLSMMSAFRVGQESAAMGPTNCRSTTIRSGLRYGRRCSWRSLSSTSAAPLVAPDAVEEHVGDLVGGQLRPLVGARVPDTEHQGAQQQGGLAGLHRQLLAVR